MLDRLETADALRLVGVDPKSWRNVIDRGYYTEAPAAQRGRPRQFMRDDIVALAIFSILVELGLLTGHAARLASDVRGWMRRDDRVETLFIAKTTDASGQPRADVHDAVPPGGRELFPLQIGRWRREWAAEMARVIGESESDVPSTKI